MKTVAGFLFTCGLLIAAIGVMLDFLSLGFIRIGDPAIYAGAVMAAIGFIWMALPEGRPSVIFGIAILVIALIVIGSLGIGRLVSLQNPEATVNNFCSELQAVNYDAAYNELSADFQSSVPRSDFGFTMGRYRCTSHTSVKNSQTTIVFNTSLIVYAVLIQGAWGIWKINRLDGLEFSSQYGKLP